MWARNLIWKWLPIYFLYSSFKWIWGWRGGSWEGWKVCKWFLCDKEQILLLFSSEVSRIYIYLEFGSRQFVKECSFFLNNYHELLIQKSVFRSKENATDEHESFVRYRFLCKHVLVLEICSWIADYLQHNISSQILKYILLFLYHDDLLLLYNILLIDLLYIDF